MTVLRLWISVLLIALAAPLAAVEPDEMLDDPLLEKRARHISDGLRCLVCQNESIDESNASLAKDLRILVRERLSEGDSDTEVVDYIVARYGEFVLLQPTTGGWNWVLWATGPIGFVLALLIAAGYLRARSKAPVKPVEGLSAEEQARLDEIMKG
ncbi:Cytochrome c-type biogenesis protein CcmH precursor [Pelagimonas phthalicica]|uniref:Cytochrome c-type biogenesis protein n=1 Tax=Pelagimonas phthalicica TaxID=1037362 RepID=A0A238JDM2_9RHOB|nr:cytochrome c-type biogenesis protein [Pelagimonas phthalicica]TDS91731.1 cytochrome c-type biogenesis protein CcmH [Pelagimonas phthalicica]SMX28780.1 Cytochrome c-type biogenesis protein CcmH precursor [Pelagimonas phthalicica]